MKDQYNREIDYLRISVTDRCNLRCLYCMPEGIQKKDKEEILSDEEIIGIVKDSVQLGIKKIRFTGGEPLVRKGIYSLIKQVSTIEGIEEIVLTTNGTLLLDNVAKLKESGVTRVNLSLDSLKNKKYNKIINANVSFNYVELIKELHDNGLEPIKINCVLLKGINDKEIMEFLALSKQHNVQVRFIELMPFDSPQFNYEDYFISIDEVLKTYPSLIFSHKQSNVDYYHIENEETKIGFINAISDKFCEDCNRIRLTSDGYLKPCLHSNDEIVVKSKNNEEIIKRIKQAITSKPKQHKLDRKYADSSKRSMNKIGG